MKLELDSLKCAKMLSNGGLNTGQADAIAMALTDCEIWNLFNRDEVMTMVNEGLDRIIEKYERKWAEDQRRLDDKHREDLRELRIGRRWLTGLIITCTLALAGYLSALIHITH
ncbi:MAG: hypothetical protein K0U29_04170 [Gammaproteobacteria bacterium]|nr:hypothetical protein [Gammaproteobacteria bacterium]MCH9744111.1 hypothetical protein [Gammaproteobacteria bacterium]